MAHDPASQRRRAATAVLSNVLDESSMLQSLWLLQETMRGEQASDVITYIDAVARRHMIDAGTCKRLYTDLYKALREPEDRLPLDPWPAMQALRPAPPVAAPRPAPAPAYWPPAPSPMYPAAPMMPPQGYPAQAMSQPGYGPGYAPPAPVYAPAPVAAPVYAPEPPAPAAPPAIAIEPPVVFGAVMRQVVSEVFQYHREALLEVQRDALRALEGSRATPVMQQRFRDAWKRPQQDDWQLQGSHADLAELTRVLFLALTEAFGRVGADQILQRALGTAEGLPEARQFSPKRLLASM